MKKSFYISVSERLVFFHPYQNLPVCGGVSASRCTLCVHASTLGSHSELTEVEFLVSRQENCIFKQIPQTNLYMLNFENLYVVKGLCCVLIEKKLKVGSQLNWVHSEYLDIYM